ncbi:mandelate racemase/muconate lactonizing enzyme family protein [Desertihabitans aurantiacus]|uniref:mandelate racemase/muconate lactonizing enzyme family protein n=1 Tax=Desertihabitans aurantiacus TaxID=2282477 RepID=UPI000DF7E145|nr:mandelate racemase/muconate lactonizing enzyme family protein [Desertihabitans aurantiacus]
MKVTGYRSLTTVHDWGRPIGDVNGVVESGRTDVPLLLVETDAGITGVGLGAHPGVEDVFEAVLGRDPRSVTAIYDAMLDRAFKVGHAASFGAIGALDTALWDIKAKAAGEPLWRLLGAADRVVPAYASGLDTGLDEEELHALYRRFAERGFTAAKLKGGLSLSRDLDRFAVVCDALSPALAPDEQPVLMLDVNESWHPSHALRYLARLEEQVDLSWVEEPVRRWDVEGHRRVRDGCRAAVASGENLTGLERFEPLLRADAVDVVQTGSVWGITHFLRVAALAHGLGLPVSPVAYDTNPLAHAAAAVPNHLVLEVQDLGLPFGLQVDHELQDGSVVLGDRPGLGLEVDVEAITAGGGDGSWGSVAGPHTRPTDAGRRLRLDDRRGTHA